LLHQPKAKSPKRLKLVFQLAEHKAIPDQEINLCRHGEKRISAFEKNCVYGWKKKNCCVGVLLRSIQVRVRKNDETEFSCADNDRRFPGLRAQRKASKLFSNSQWIHQGETTCNCLKISLKSSYLMPARTSHSNFTILIDRFNSLRPTALNSPSPSWPTSR